jgi:hypothetical protein
MAGSDEYQFIAVYPIHHAAWVTASFLAVIQHGLDGSVTNKRDMSSLKLLNYVKIWEPSVCDQDTQINYDPTDPELIRKLIDKITELQSITIKSKPKRFNSTSPSIATNPFPL